MSRADHRAPLDQRAPVDELAPAAALAPITLAELDGLAALQTRVDRKYVLPLADVERLLGALPRGARALEIDGARAFAYESVYFDTPELTSYLLAARGRRRRFKVRTRTYLDSASCWLEVKTRDNRGRTVKQRLAYSPADRATLTGPGRRFADGVLDAAAVQGIAAMSFAPTLVTRYTRSTVYLPAGPSRVTIDTDLEWACDGGWRLRLPGLGVVETKTGATASSVDRLLWARGHRPAAMSKYATGLAAAHPDLPAHRWLPVLRHHFTPVTPLKPVKPVTPVTRWSPRCVA